MDLSYRKRPIQILDESSQVVARAGEEVYMGGGEVMSIESVKDLLQQPLPSHCIGPYWVVGEGVRFNINRDSELFDLDVIKSADKTVFFIREKSAIRNLEAYDAVIRGEIVLLNRCLHFQQTNTSSRFVIIWPPDFTANLEDEVINISDKDGTQTIRLGDQIIIEGKKIPLDWQSELYRRLQNDLPGDCNGPYLLITEIDTHI